MRRHHLSVWLRQVARNASDGARSTSVLGPIYAAKDGVAIAPLPLSPGDARTDLVRALGPVPDLTRAWPLLAHPDRRRTRRVTAFFDIIAGETDASKPIQTG